MKIALVIPAYNESRYLASVLEKAKASGLPFVVIDDGSRDATYEIAQTFTPHALHHAINLGKGSALKTGCEYAFRILDVDAVIFLDADAQHDPTEIPAFVAALEKGNDAVFGVRQKRGDMPFVRRLGNHLASLWSALVLGEAIPDIPSGFKALTRTAYEKAKWNSFGYGVESEIVTRVVKHDLRYALVPIQTIYHDKLKGMNLSEALRIGIRMPLWRIKK